MAQSRTLKGKPRKAYKESKTLKPRTQTKAQRIKSVNTQHGVLAALVPIGLIGFAIAELVPWDAFQDVLYLAWIGNLIGYGLRRFNP